MSISSVNISKYKYKSKEICDHNQAKDVKYIPLHTELVYY